MNNLKYKLKNKIPVPCENAIEWALWFTYNFEERIVGIYEDDDNYKISTVFLGYNINFIENPKLFETAVFKDDIFIEIMQRYRTWEEAEIGHEKTIKSLPEIKEIVWD